MSQQSGYGSESTTSSSADILDLTLPDKNAATEVCYVCGDEFKRGSLHYIQTRPAGRTPHYPSLVHHPRPPRSRPLDSAGRLHACEECSSHLAAQWETFESEKLPHSDRSVQPGKNQKDFD